MGQWVAGAGWYIRLLRDEVLAEWAVPQGGAPQLHVYCHVSGQERWLAPPQLRNYIFKREMPLVGSPFASPGTAGAGMGITVCAISLSLCHYVEGNWMSANHTRCRRPNAVVAAGRQHLQRIMSR